MSKIMNAASYPKVPDSVIKVPLLKVYASPSLLISLKGPTKKKILQYIHM